MAELEKVEIGGVPPEAITLVKGLLAFFDPYALKALAYFLYEQGIIADDERNLFITLVEVLGDEDL